MPRRLNDQYFSPDLLPLELSSRVFMSGMAYEPCVGTGNIVKALTHLTWVTNDIDQNFLATTHVDATKSIPSEALKCKWLITNPPFNQAIDILKLHYFHFENLAFLVRLSFLEPTFERSEFLSEFPPNRLIVLPRVSFTGDRKTDSVTCCWAIWQRNPLALSTVRPIEICLKKK